MYKISALEFSLAGDKYLGRPYSEMDCQAFAERCMADCGYRKNLAGSNAWYRECVNHGWVGTPEECVRVFGCVPKGALLFILEQDRKEPVKYRPDGLGNAVHIGIKTGRGKGAIHSSAGRGCVTESEFGDRTVRNGGWNRVGLLEAFEYEMNNSEFRIHNSQLSKGDKGKKNMTVTVSAPTGSTVNMRVKPSKGASLLERVPVGTEVVLLEGGEGWSRIRYGNRTGWMMTEFLAADERLESETDSGGTYSVTVSGLDLSQARALMNNYPGSVMEREVG